MIRFEDKERASTIEANFKSQLLSANPMLYARIFEEEKDPEEIEWRRPQSEGDVRAILADLKAAGVDAQLAE